MGVDATIFVIANYSRETAYADAMIELGRDADLWDALCALPYTGHRASLQVMRGSWGRFSDGERPDPEQDRECGYLFGDSYEPDAGFKVYNVSSLATIAKSQKGKNGAILAFLLAAYPHHNFIIIWH